MQSGKQGIDFEYDQNIKHQVVSQEFKLLWSTSLQRARKKDRLV